MKEAFPFFLLDPTIDLGDQERIAYAQDVFIAKTIFQGEPLPLCNGSIEEGEGKCELCKAPTRDMPHADKADILPFSSSFAVLPDLMKAIMCKWSLQDLRLLGDIMRYEPLDVAQDIIHVYQKRHPLGMTHMYQVVQRHIRNIEPDFMRSLAQDVYFLPYRSLPRLGMYNKYTEYAAKLVVGRVAADLQLSPQTRRCLSCSHFEGQWIVYNAERILLIPEHPEWNVDWIAAWDAYMHEMKRQEQEDRENYLGNI